MRSAFCYDADLDTWLLYDDHKVRHCFGNPMLHNNIIIVKSQITVASKDQVLKAQAYLLFYERVGAQ
jgi:hypothetical protein